MTLNYEKNIRNGFFSQNFTKKGITLFFKYKLCSLTYQALTSGQPLYIRNMLQPSRKVRTLRSSDLDQLNVPRIRTAVVIRAFSVAAPRLWNELPLEICSAKTQISFRKKL